MKKVPSVAWTEMDNGREGKDFVNTVFGLF